MSYKPDIVVVGSCNIDLIFYTNRIPKRGETIYGSKFITGCGGKGANQCVAASKLGASTAMIARVGDDQFGQDYMNVFDELNINSKHVLKSKGVSTGVAQITVSENTGDNYILIVDGANSLLSKDDVINASDVIKCAKVGIFQFEISLKTTIEAMEYFKEISQAKLILNPAPALENLDPKVFALCDIIVANETEAEVLSKQEVKTVEDAYLASNVLLNKGCNTVIITLGGQGAVYASKQDCGPAHVKIDPVDNPIDTTGAGDLFIGALAYSFVHKNDLALKDKIKFACEVARESVKKPGTQISFPFKNEIPHLIN